jgi:hypothetical protein
LILLFTFQKSAPVSKDAKSNNFLSNYELILQIKQKKKDAPTYSVIETLDITKLTYSQLYNKIMDNVNNYNNCVIIAIIQHNSNK